MLLTELLERNAREYPKAPALTMRMGYRTVTLNYAQVYSLSCRIALFLQQQDVGMGDKVVIFAPNSPFWVCVFYGAMLNGSIIVPANTQSTAQMLDKIIDHTQAKIVFKSRYVKKHFSADIPTFDIELIDELVGDDAPVRCHKNSKENDLIEILYTSGTTGDPKGVMLTHKNIYSNVEAISHVIDFKPATECLLSVLPLTHILEQTIGLFLAFYYAAHVVYAHSYAAIGQLLQEYKIKKMVAVPEILKVLMERIKTEADKKGKLWLLQKMLHLSVKIGCRPFSKILFYGVRQKLGGRLDTIASGGAPLDPGLEIEWNALGLYIIQGYGLTETSPVVTLNTFDMHRFASVGRVLEGVQIKLAPDGEVLVKGPSVFQGYYQDAARTKSTFTSDGWFMTGDIGYLDSDGFLFLKGRKKYMILGPGGQNVFPEDIEEELNKVDVIKDSCVLGLDRAGKNVEIHAVLLLRERGFVEKGESVKMVRQAHHERIPHTVRPAVPGEALREAWEFVEGLVERDQKKIENIIDQVNQNLASYQQINSWSVWHEDDFPRSATRKVKRDDVLKIIQAKQAGSKSAITEAHSKVAKILSLVSGVDLAQIHPTTRIIRDLNMDSLMRVEFVMRVEQEMGFGLDETAIDVNSTVQQLEQIIDQGKFAAKKIVIKNWPRKWWAKILRSVGQLCGNLISRSFIKIEIEGLENIQNLSGPAIFMPNHISYFDPLVVIRALPFQIRQTLSFAAAQDILYGQFKWVAWLGDLFFNSFSLPRLEDSNVRAGLEIMGRMLDNGYSVVVFPEGKISLDGKFQPLKAGAGLMAIEMDVSVIPIKIEGADNIAPYGCFIPRHRALVKIKIGKPLQFKKADSYESAKSQIEDVMKNL